MKKNSIAESYASSLFEIARAEGKLEQVESDLDQLKEVLKNHKDIGAFLKGRDTTPEGKKKALREIFGDYRTNKKGLSPITLNQLNLLIDQEREREIPAMVEAYDQLLSSYRKKLTAVITTSVPLNEEESNKIEKKLSEKTGMSVHLKTRVDEDILGGAIIRIGDNVIDGSIRRHLEELRKNMIN
jgi:F-type H+-transporting ATPase subunit delta